MVDSNDVDVFVSYAHEDRERVRPLVEKFKAAGLLVWWDTEIEVGNKWRHVISDRLAHAKSVCVFWSTRSTKRDFVLDEAEDARGRGILIPVLLDDIKPPLGFREVQFLSLANPSTTDEVITSIVSTIRQLSQHGVGVELWQTIDNGAQATRYGAREADRFLADVRARSDVLRQNPGSERALRDALRGVRQTYEVVIDAIDQFLAPLTTKSHLELDRYSSIASGRMVEEIERRRGHCKSITAIYIESGGLRESLPSTVSSEAKDALDDLMFSIAGADGDLFKQMTDVGSALAMEGAIITNLLLAEQPQSVQDHLRKCASKLLPLQHELTQGMGRVDRLMLDLGIDLLS
jgi:hypothetical protein